MSRNNPIENTTKEREEISKTNMVINRKNKTAVMDEKETYPEKDKIKTKIKTVNPAAIGSITIITPKSVATPFPPLNPV